MEKLQGAFKSWTGKLRFSSSKTAQLRDERLQEFNSKAEAGPERPIALPSTEDVNFVIPQHIREFDMFSVLREPVRQEEMRAFSDSGNRNALLMLRNAVSGLFADLSRVVRSVREKRFQLTHSDVDRVFTWISEIDEHGFTPIFASLNNVVLPHIDQHVTLSSESELCQKKRGAYLKNIRSKFEDMHACIEAFISKLPAGERIIVLVYYFAEVENVILEVLDLLGKMTKDETMLRPVKGEDNLLDRYAYEILIYGTGDGFKSQEMRGILTGGMSDRQVKQLRSRLNLMKFSKQPKLMAARSDYRAESVIGLFPRALSIVLGEISEEKRLFAEDETSERIDKGVAHRLNIMAAERLMMRINGEVDIDDDAVVLEEMSGEVCDNDVTLYYGNSHQIAREEGRSTSVEEESDEMMRIRA